jgi:hypothetical protein
MRRIATLLSAVLGGELSKLRATILGHDVDIDPLRAFTRRVD